MANSDDWFVDYAEAAGLDFVHFNGMSGEYYFPEIIPAGVGLFDYDNDGDLDAYFVQGQMMGPDKTFNDALFAPVGPLPLRSRLYRNDLHLEADGTRSLHFTDVTTDSGLDVQGHGMGIATGDIDNDGDFDQLFSYGARSFSIFNMSAGAELVYDSGDEFATTISQFESANFNSNSTSNNSADGRSDNKGAEPEAVVVGQLGDRSIAFIGLERQGGIFIYDVTTPAQSEFLGYFSNRNFIYAHAFRGAKIIIGHHGEKNPANFANF